MNRSAHISRMDQQTKIHSSLDKSREKNQTPKLKCATNKLYSQTKGRQNLNQSYNSNQKTNPKFYTNSGSDVQQKLLDEILRGSQSHVSQSYLTSVVKEKVVPRPLQNNKSVDISSFTLPDKDFSVKPTLKLMENFVREECSKLGGKNSLYSFEELLEQLEVKEIELKTHIFSDLRSLFTFLSQSVTKKILSQEAEISKLQQYIFQLQQPSGLAKQVNEQPSVIYNNTDDINSFLFTLRQTDEQIATKPITDQVQTYKPKIGSQLENDQEEQSQGLESAIPGNKCYNYYCKKSIHPKMGVDFSLDLHTLTNPKTAPMGYQEEFMANIKEFSESWRIQALREQRC